MAKTLTRDCFTAALRVREAGPPISAKRLLRRLDSAQTGNGRGFFAIPIQGSLSFGAGKIGPTGSVGLSHEEVVGLVLPDVEAVLLLGFFLVFFLAGGVIVKHHQDSSVSVYCNPLALMGK